MKINLEIHPNNKHNDIDVYPIHLIFISASIITIPITITIYSLLPKIISQIDFMILNNLIINVDQKLLKQGYHYDLEDYYFYGRELLF